MENIQSSRWHSKSSDLKQHIEEGKQGKKLGASVGLKRLEALIHGFASSRYYLIGADSNVGKTTLADYILINVMLDYIAKGKKLHVYYFSFEIPKVDKQLKWCAYFIFKKYGINLPIDYLSGTIKGMKITEEHERMLIEAYEIVDKLFDHIIWITSKSNEADLYGNFESFFSKHGTINYYAQTEAEKTAKSKLRFKSFEKNDPDILVIGVVDHIGLVGEGKSEIDAFSKNVCMATRNHFGMSWLVVQQFNPDFLANYEEAKIRNGSKAKLPTPSRSDYGDSRLPFRDADYVFSLIKPMQFDIESFAGYNCRKADEGGLGDFLLLLFVTKNRHGRKDLIFPLFMNFTVGAAYDLPKATDGFMEDESTWVFRSRALLQEQEKFTIKEEEEECNYLNNEWELHQQSLAI